MWILSILLIHGLAVAQAVLPMPQAGMSTAQAPALLPPIPLRSVYPSPMPVLTSNIYNGPGYGMSAMAPVFNPSYAMGGGLSLLPSAPLGYGMPMGMGVAMPWTMGAAPGLYGGGMPVAVTSGFGLPQFAQNPFMPQTGFGAVPSMFGASPFLAGANSLYSGNGAPVSGLPSNYDSECLTCRARRPLAERIESRPRQDEVELPDQCTEARSRDVWPSTPVAVTPRPVVEVPATFSDRIASTRSYGGAEAGNGYNFAAAGPRGAVAGSSGTPIYRATPRYNYTYSLAPAPVRFDGTVIRPYRRGNSCPLLEANIRAVVAPSQVACYSRLFAVEGSCSTTVPHDRRRTRNPNYGIGLCALESDPNVRARNGRGRECSYIGSTDAQIRCCVHIMRTWGAQYFGSIRTGRARRCH